MKRNKKFIYIVSLLFFAVAVLSQCMSNKDVASDPRGKAYAGTASCRQCHQAIYDSVLLTAHYNASSPATGKHVLGSFIEGQNVFVYGDSIKVAMEKRDSGMYQVLYIGGKEELACRFDITFGLRKGQTSLYWHDKNTYQLPVSYYTSAHNWGTSPGFSNMLPEFNRLVGVNCFECHSSYIRTIQNPEGQQEDKQATEEMNKSTLVYGIDCERCHGPSAEHVNYQLKNPAAKMANHVIASSTLNAQQNLDRCTVCHAGNDKIKLKSRFLFRPGDVLADYFQEGSSSSTIDVHGNQYGLLEQSKCFRAGTTALNCITCHDPHTNANKNMVFYSAKCMSCHSEAGHNFCKVKAPAGTVLADNCIDCHMPQQPSGIINFQLSGSPERIAEMFRSHRIAVYPAGKP
jgi:hypothetical protein